MTFTKGQSGHPSGKPPGTTSKFTNLKAAFLKVFNDLGGAEELLKWASKSEYNKRIFYQWLTKMLPSSSTMGLDEETRKLVYELSEQFIPKKEEKKEE